MVHEEILKQLGGNRFLVMTGCNNLSYSNIKLSMHLRKNSSKAKYLTITLDSNDTYTMTFSTIKSIKDEYGFKSEIVVEIAEFKNVYAYELKKVFTEVTLLKTSL